MFKKIFHQLFPYFVIADIKSFFGKLKPFILQHKKAAIIAVIIVLVSSASIRILGSRQEKIDVEKTSMTGTITPTDEPEPTEEFISEDNEEDDAGWPTPTKKPAATSAPTASPTPTNSPTNTPAPTATSAPTASPTPAPDTTPPNITKMTGPENNETVHIDDFCFPVEIQDNVSTAPNILTQYQFDTAEWTNWGANYSPCFSDVPDGTHTFSLRAKDAAGNISFTVSVNFTVDTP